MVNLVVDERALCELYPLNDGKLAVVRGVEVSEIFDCGLGDGEPPLGQDQTDHLSVRGRNDALDLLEERDYSGLITSHSWGDESSQRRLAELGGVAAPSASSPPGFIEEWEKAKEAAHPSTCSASASAPTPTASGASRTLVRGNEANPVEYPYETFDGGTTMERQVSGERTFDVNVDGVAQ